MSRIIVPVNTLVGRKLTALNNLIIQASDDASRLKAIVDQIGSGNLESSAESNMPAGSGTTIYNGIAQIKTALDGLASLVSVIDQG
jgi:uncharacterized phage infection (PIP) family protein YhgE